MNQCAAKQLWDVRISEKVISCEVIQSDYWHEEFRRNETVWGIQICFSDDRIITIPDLCTKREDTEKFVQRIDGASLCEESLPDIVDDYLGELYGLSISH